MAPIFIVPIILGMREDRDKGEIVPIGDMTILSAVEYGSDSTHPLHHCNFMAQLSTVKQFYFKMPHLFLYWIVPVPISLGNALHIIRFY